MKKACLKTLLIFAGILTLVLLTFTFVSLIFSFLPREMNAAYARQYLDGHEAQLISACSAVRDRYVFGEDLPNEVSELQKFGLHAIEGRDEGTDFFFPLFGEKYCQLSYRSNGTFSYSDYDFLLNADNPKKRIEGVGMGGLGYIQGEYIQDGWFFVEIYLPT